jgi:hypothetical protein
MEPAGEVKSREMGSCRYGGELTPHNNKRKGGSKKPTN